LLLKEAIDQLNNRLSILTDSKTKRAQDSIIKALNILALNYNNKDYKIGLAQYAIHVISEIQRVEKLVYEKDAAGEFRLDAQGNRITKPLDFKSNELLKQFLSFYKPLIESVLENLGSDFIDIATGLQAKDASIVIQTPAYILDEFNKLDRSWRENTKRLTVENLPLVMADLFNIKETGAALLDALNKKGFNFSNFLEFQESVGHTVSYWLGNISHHSNAFVQTIYGLISAQKVKIQRQVLDESKDFIAAFNALGITGNLKKMYVVESDPTLLNKLKKDLSVLKQELNILKKNAVTNSFAILTKEDEIRVLKKEIEIEKLKNAATFVSPTDLQKFSVARMEFFGIHQTTHGYIDFSVKRDELIRTLGQKGYYKSSFYKELIAWYKKNTEPLPTRNIQYLVTLYKKNVTNSIWTQKMYDEWFESSVIRDFNGNVVGYKGDLSRPKKSLYASGKYDALTPNEKKGLDLIIQKKHQLDQRYGRMPSNKVPALFQSTLDMWYSNRPAIQDIGNKFVEKVKEATNIDQLNDEEQFGKRITLSDETYYDGGFIPLQPHLYSGTIQYDELSGDLLGGLLAYLEAATDYRQMATLLPQINTYTDLLRDATGIRKNLLSNSVSKKTGDNTALYKSIRTFVEMNGYNMQKEQLEVGSVNVTKVIDRISSWMRTKNLGLNVIALSTESLPIA
jgi:hypothetical protein